MPNRFFYYTSRFCPYKRRGSYAIHKLTYMFITTISYVNGKGLADSVFYSYLIERDLTVRKYSHASSFVLYYTSFVSISKVFPIALDISFYYILLRYYLCKYEFLIANKVNTNMCFSFDEFPLLSALFVPLFELISRIQQLLQQ